MNTAEYTRAHLFRPIGITGDRWYRGFPNQLPHTGGGLFLSTRDLTRVGYLVLRRGRWNANQVVPESWITESTRPIVTPTYRLNAGIENGPDPGLDILFRDILPAMR